MSEQPANQPDQREGLFIHTFGCQMNEHDSLKLARILEERYRIVASPEEAQLIIINTCSVRDKPEQKVYSMLGRMKQLKRRRPGVLVGVGGCVAQQEGERLARRSSAVDFVFGTHNLSMVPGLIDLRKKGFPPQIAVDYRDEWEGVPLGFPAGRRVAVPVAISRGCNKNCSYCIVPVTRGCEVSRAPDEIEREVKIAVQRGAREILLLGQTVNSYGGDLEPRLGFSGLIERLSAIEGLRRIRFTSPHPQEVRRDLIECLASNPKVCRHIHMPLQSGSDQILRAMNRNYRRARYLNIIQALKSRIPDLAVTTDIIVGFPGETESDFNDTLDVMNQVRFEGSYSFVFSARPGTAAASLPDPVPYDEKLARLQMLQARQEEISRESLAAWVGRTAEVLIDGHSEADKNCLQGRSSQNTVINLDPEQPGVVAHRPGDVVEVFIKDAARFTLHGKIVANSG